MALTEIHGRLATSVILYTVLVAIWGLWRFFRKEGVNSSYWGALAIGAGLFVVQGLLGTLLYLRGLRADGGWIHILYGVTGVLVIPALFFFTRGGEGRRVMLVYGVGLLFLMGIALRAMATGG